MDLLKLNEIEIEQVEELKEYFSSSTFRILNLKQNE